MFRRTFPAALAVIFLGEAFSPLSSQTNPPANSGQKVTLDDVWVRVLEVDYRKRASEQMVASAQETLAYAKANQKPELSVESGYTMNDRIAGTRLDLIPGFEATVPVLQKNFYFLRTGVLLPVFTGGRISSGILAARSGVDIANAEKERILLEIKLNAAETYLNVLRAKRFVELAEKNLQTLKAHTIDVERLHREGVLARNDLLTVQVAMSGARQKVMKARNSLLLATAAFHRLMHDETMDGAVDLQEMEPDLTIVDLDESLVKAQTHRPELLIIKGQMRALELQAKIHEQGDLPQAAISGGYNAIQDRYLAHQDLWSVTVGFRWKLYDGGRSKHEANALHEKADAMKSILEETIGGISLQVRQAWLNVNEARDRIGAAKEAIDQAEENVRITRHRFAQGLSTNTELLDAETLLDQSYTNYESARYDAVQALLLLKKMEGTL